MFLFPLLAAPEALADAVVRSSAGANAAAIQATVDQFRTDLGTLNANVAGSFMTGRREINWDGVPDTSSAPNNLPADFFNVSSPRGVVLSTPGTGLRVSADSSNPTGTPVEFGDIDPSYPTLFAPFSAERLFTPIGSNIVDVTFFVPGTTILASVSGFGAVFSDVDVVNTTSIEFFDAANNSLGSFFAPASGGNQGFSFLGVFFDAGERVARVRITCGSQVLAAGNTASDLVVLDDFIYGEPVPFPNAIAINDASGSLIRFNTRTPQTVTGTYAVSGLVAGENLAAIDFRPMTGQLFGLVAGNTGSARVVTLRTTGGPVTQLGNGIAVSGTNFGFDFNPTIDRIRLTNDNDQNISISATDGVATFQTPLNPGNPNVVGSAYTNSIPGATTTTLYGIDSNLDALVLQNPAASGTLTTLGPMGVNTNGLVGFDIQGFTNTGYVTLTPTVSRLYAIALDTGVARLMGTGVIGSNLTVRGMALVPQAPTIAMPLNTQLLAVGTNNLLRFNSDTPSTIISTVAITGLVAGETIEGIDVRPANQRLYAIGITNGPGANDSAARLYTINPTTGAATPVVAGNAPIISNLTDNASYGIDFNPAVDRIRLVSSADPNFRINPDTGGLTVDFPLENGSGTESVGAIAYDRNDNDATTGTTLYAIDGGTGMLSIVGSIDANPVSPNSGALNIVGPLGAILTSSANGFEIDANGHAFAALRVGTSSNLYSIDLVNGSATPRGPIGNGTVLIKGLTTVPTPCQVTCPTNITIATQPNQCGAVVSYPAATSNCSTTAAPASGSFFPKGTTTVTVTAADGGTSCTFTVTVVDTQAPSVTCPADITKQANPGANGATVDYPDATATDNCPGVTLPQYSKASGSFFPIGQTTVTASTTDAAANSASCSFVVTVTPGPTPTPTPTATPGSLANISTRLRVETGDNALIGGFIVTGTEDKKVIIRAIGPSLALPDKLPNPTLELRDSSGTLLQANDDWVDSPDKENIIDTSVAPANDLESAILARLPANGSGYTAIVRGANDTVGTGVVEVYDLNVGSDSSLANISTRGFVQTGDRILIAGTIVVGDQAKKVIIRAIGPSLDVAGKLANPILELRDINGALLEENDNWVDSANKDAIIASGVAPSHDLESAIVRTLPANGAAYTAIVHGVDDSTGIAVVEVYALQ